MPLPAVLDPVERVGPEGGAQPREAAPVRLELPGIATAFRVRPGEPLALETTDQGGAPGLVDPAGSEIHGCTLERIERMVYSAPGSPGRRCSASRRNAARLLPGAATAGAARPSYPLMLPPVRGRRAMPPSPPVGG